VDCAQTSNSTRTLTSTCTASRSVFSGHRCHLIHLSTDWVYEGSDSLVVESSPRVSGFGMYGRSKRTAEEVIQKETPGGAFTILRSALMYGPPSPLTGKHSFLKVTNTHWRSGLTDVKSVCQQELTLLS
jgi:dTDP-4-dehydrorhamnose reductase